MTDDAIEQLLQAIHHDLPQPFARWPGGWPNEIEAALIDAVLSIRAKYGQPHNGVRGAVGRYRAEHVDSLDSLSRLASYEEESLKRLLGVSQQTSGRSKVSAIIEAAQAFGRHSVEHAADLKVGQHKSAYVRVHGLGPVTWEYFTMLLGKPGVKADVWIVRWVSQAVGQGDSPLSKDEAHDLLVETHRRMEADELSGAPSLTQLDHAIWLHASGNA